MKCILVKFPTHVIASSFSEIVKIENIRIPNKNDVDRGSDCEVRGPGKLYIQIESDWLLICLNFAAVCFSVQTILLYSAVRPEKCFSLIPKSPPSERAHLLNFS